MYLKPASPQTIGGVLDDAIKLYRASFSACWPVAAATAAISGAIMVYLMWHVLGSVVFNPSSPMQALNVYRQPAVSLSYLALALARLAAYGAMLIYQNSLGDNDGVLSMQQALGLMLGRLLPGVLASIACWVVIAIGFALLLVPGIYLMGALCLWPACLFVGEAGPLRSLEQSRELVRGHWWRTATILGVAAILIFALSSMAGMVLGALVGFGTLRKDLVMWQLSVQVITAFVSVFSLPSMPAVLLAIYRDLKLRREGSDLAARLGALGPS